MLLRTSDGGDMPCGWGAAEDDSPWENLGNSEGSSVFPQSKEGKTTEKNGRTEGIACTVGLCRGIWQILEGPVAGARLQKIRRRESKKCVAGRGPKIASVGWRAGAQPNRVSTNEIEK